MAETQPMREEMRRTRRFTLRLPISLAFDGSGKELSTQTLDLSAHGTRFLVDSSTEVGATFQFTLTFPPEITLAESIRVRGRGRVLRVEPAAANGATAVAAALDELAYLPPL